MNKYVIGDKCSQSECFHSSHHGDNTHNNCSQSKRVSVSHRQEIHEKSIDDDQRDAFENESNLYGQTQNQTSLTFRLPD